MLHIIAYVFKVIRYFLLKTAILENSKSCKSVSIANMPIYTLMDPIVNCS